MIGRDVLIDYSLSFARGTLREKVYVVDPLILFELKSLYSCALT